jgi:hypothetical protein
MDSRTDRLEVFVAFSLDKKQNASKGMPDFGSRRLGLAASFVSTYLGRRFSIA